MTIADRVRIIDALAKIPEEYLVTAEEIAAVLIKEDQDQNKSGKDRPPREEQNQKSNCF